MKDSITIYSLPSCGMCSLLKRELDKNSIKYLVCEDSEKMRSMNITNLPTLEVNGKFFTAKEALKLIKLGDLC